MCLKSPDCFPSIQGPSVGVQLSVEERQTSSLCWVVLVKGGCGTRGTTTLGLRPDLMGRWYTQLVCSYDRPWNGDTRRVKGTPLRKDEGVVWGFPENVVLTQTVNPQPTGLPLREITRVAILVSSEKNTGTEIRIYEGWRLRFTGRSDREDTSLIGREWCYCTETFLINLKYHH